MSKARFYIEEQISENIAETPEGLGPKVRRFGRIALVCACGCAPHRLLQNKLRSRKSNFIMFKLSCKTGAGKRHVWVNFFDNLKNGNALEVVNV